MFEHLKTIEDCFKAVGIDPALRPIVDHLPEKYRLPLVRNLERTIITEAINKADNRDETWKPDWSDNNYKRQPWFGIEKDKNHPSGFGFSGTSCADPIAHTLVGSRHCFKTPDGWRHAVDNFKEIFQDEILLM